MKPDKYDFGGYATKNDIRCTDGRVIRQDAFKHDDGRVVPLVWQHGSSDPGNLLGHAYLENRADGVYTYAVFNDSPNAHTAKDLVEHKAVNMLSIYANKLGQVGKDVMSGVIREVSLVLSGANSGAMIDDVAFSHGEFDDDSPVDEAVIFTGEAFSLYHSDEEPPEAEPVAPVVPVVEEAAEVVHAAAPAAPAAPVAPAATEDDKTVGDILATLTDKQQMAVGFLIDQLENGGNSEVAGSAPVAHADAAASGETVGDVLATLNDDQKAAVGFLIDELENDTTDTSAQHSEEEIEHMKSNVFDQNEDEPNVQALTHEDFVEIMAEGKKLNSFKAAFMQHMEDKGYELQHAGGLEAGYGLENIGVLFPDAKNVSGTPDFVQRDTTWVGAVMNGTHHTPFSRIKSMSADITPDEARAKGYVTSALKVEEVFALLSRSTEPTTIYKKQKLDRDDVLDITDFDVIVWLQSEMRLMLNEEIARAILIGDGRPALSPDKIKEDKIRPIATDEELYAVHVDITGATAADRIDEIIRAAKNYKGSGSPTLFASTDVVTDLLLVKDTLGRRLYATMEELASGLRVSSIVEVEVMAGVTNPTTHKPLYGIIVNLNDYSVGTDRGGDVNAFSDFDIDYNQQKYLIETRMSGALTKPKSALVLELPVPQQG